MGAASPGVRLPGSDPRAARRFATFQTTGPAFLNDLEELSFGDAVWIFINDPAGALWEQPSFTAARDVDLLAGFNLVLWAGREAPR